MKHTWRKKLWKLRDTLTHKLTFEEALAEMEAENE